MPVEEAIKRVLEDEISDAKKFFRNWLDLELISKDDFDLIFNDLEDQEDGIVKCIRSVIIIENLEDEGVNKGNTKVGLKTFAIDDEFDVKNNLLADVLLNGKIDLLCYIPEYIRNELHQKEFQIIEIKTGSYSDSKSNQWKRQLRIYGAVFQKELGIAPDLSLWVTSNTEDEEVKMKAKMNQKALVKVSNIVKIARKIRREDDPSLQKSLDQQYSHDKCDPCPYCSNIRKILGLEGERDLFSFALNDASPKAILETYGDDHFIIRIK